MTGNQALVVDYDVAQPGLPASWPKSVGAHESVATVPIGAVRASASPRLRGPDPEHVKILAAIAEQLPPILVRKSTMEVIDGVHRLRAAELRGDTSVRVTYFDGDPNDAFVLSVRLNVKNGLPLTQADRIAAATRIICSHPEWSDRRIARISGLSANTVGSVRARTGRGEGTAVARVGMDGKIRPVDPVEGRMRAVTLIERQPDASLREIASAAGIGLGTAQDVRNRIRNGQDPIPPKLRGAKSAGPQETKDAPAARPVRTAQDVNQLFDALRRDPSLRFNESGRVVLRMLSAHFMQGTEWNRIADSMPPHCVEAVVQAAMHCSEVWTRFACDVSSRLDQRP